MGFTRRDFLALAGVGTLAGIAGCTKPEQKPAEDPGNGPQDSQVDLEEFKDLALNEGAWRYDEDNDVYYQLGLAYCKSPATKTYEALAVFVPGKHLPAAAPLTRRPSWAVSPPPRRPSSCPSTPAR